MIILQKKASKQVNNQVDYAAAERIANSFFDVIINHHKYSFLITALSKCISDAGKFRQVIANLISSFTNIRKAYPRSFLESLKNEFESYQASYTRWDQQFGEAVELTFNKLLKHKYASDPSFQVFSESVVSIVEIPCIIIESRKPFDVVAWSGNSASSSC